MSVQRISEADAYPDKCPVCGRTLAWPEELDEDLGPSAIYRRHRRNHYAWGGKGEYDPSEDPYLSQNVGADEEEDDLNEDCKVDTQYFEVEFTYEMRETIVVEATDSRDAIEQAEHKKTYDVELVDTLFTDTIEYGEPSQASLDYLENAGLLPADHDVTEDDIEDLVADSSEDDSEVSDE